MDSLSFSKDCDCLDVKSVAHDEKRGHYVIGYWIFTAKIDENCEEIQWILVDESGSITSIKKTRDQILGNGTNFVVVVRDFSDGSKKSNLSYSPSEGKKPVHLRFDGNLCEIGDFHEVVEALKIECRSSTIVDEFVSLALC